MNFDWQKIYKDKLKSAEDAVKTIKDGDRVIIGQAASMPEALLKALAGRAGELKGVRAFTALALRPNPLGRPECRGHVDVEAYFMGPQEQGYDKAFGGTTSLNFSHLDMYFRDIASPNVLLIEVTPPDKHGFFNVGNVNACVIEDIMRTNPRIIVQVNKHVPYTFCDAGFIHVDHVESVVEFDSPMPVLPNAPLVETDKQIASHIVDLVPDGACLQIGLGGVGNAVGYSLEQKKDMGVHTEMMTDSMIHLIKKGAINCSKKNFYPNRAVSAMGLGSQEMYEFMDGNPLFYALALSKVSSESFVAQNDNFVSINNCLNIDLTGQVCSESIGHGRISTTGGQQGFVRGAIRSKGGKSFILLASTAKDKEGKLISRVTLNLAPGTVVSTPRSDVQYLGTEYGCVNVFGLPPKDRAERIISIAHPDFREQLKDEAKAAGILK